jgi:8-oxo-dGTP pyrophosphatase MutT (NUDIX family)
MTIDEKEAIKTIPWDTLYDNIMNNKIAVAAAEAAEAAAESHPAVNDSPPPSVYTQRERQRAKHLYEMVDIHDLFSVETLPIKEPTWEFPKGRRFIQESEETCALREFYEETNVPLEDITVISNPDNGRDLWIEEKFCGINKRQYHNRYLLAFINPNSKGPFIDKTNSSQMSEVQDARLFSFEDAMAIIHPFHPEKQTCLIQSHEIIKKCIRLATNSP